MAAVTEHGKPYDVRDAADESALMATFTKGGRERVRRKAAISAGHHLRVHEQVMLVRIPIASVEPLTLRSCLWKVSSGATSSFGNLASMSKCTHVQRKFMSTSPCESLEPSHPSFLS
jgi:hypothetical protein